MLNFIRSLIMLLTMESYAPAMVPVYTREEYSQVHFMEGK